MDRIQLQKSSSSSLLLVLTLHCHALALALILGFFTYDSFGVISSGFMTLFVSAIVTSYNVLVHVGDELKVAFVGYLHALIMLL